MTDEQWKPIEGFEKYYMISNMGRIFSFHRNKVIKSFSNGTYGYRKINLKVKGVYASKFVHRLVAQAFIENPEHKPTVNHKDFDTSNNSAANLQWCSFKENIQHTVLAGRKYVAKGEQFKSSKLTEAQVVSIRGAHGKLSHRGLAKLYNVSSPTITNILNRKAWKHI